ncbi:hypothetical protein [Wohlfahrtiimonas chitiniclastica]|uniref:hypothetical protein n=1 Tax=Wohlfahrtiimonas chitiniclastica TaxID=400946 RepID=UPI0011D0BD8D|nr:hypothetical protein [Wohlfahrtiimonas chitiniclastica]
MKTSSNNLAKILGISQRDLDSLTYDIDEHRSKDGMLYNHFVNFYGENDPKILRKIKRLEEGSYVTLDPWEIYEYRDAPEWIDEELEWQITHSDQLEMFNKQMHAVSELAKSPISDDLQYSFLVMFHAHIVSAFEHFLSSVFIHNVINSDVLIRKLIETDPEFKSRKFTLSEIYSKHDELKHIVVEYLNGIIFHNINKIRPMFLSVLSFNFEDEDIEWLIKAVMLRHDCVHRAGYTKDGKQVDLTLDSIFKLMNNCQEIADKIDVHMRNINNPNYQKLLMCLDEVGEIFES